ncbi:MAG: 16S rRNA (guanine(966)-N(2))-methyltransferase RsmD [Gemmatimonadetes bacterium SCN 70-22]|nr:MAG: 16S rRNA (guanine(966)-N(2))-methyltransferase RsmD [Gemmatimonadetes bacterium SCN 70-22]
MRIIAGRWRGRTIKAPRDARVRPTGDRAREAWMSILHPAIPGARVVDLFAGSGALGLEALSRGAASCDFVELAAPSLRAIRENVEALGATPLVTLHRGDALRFVHKLPAGAYDIAFADPPYNLGLAPRLAEAWRELPFANVLGVEHDVHEAMPPGGDTRTYGGTAVTLYRRAPVQDDGGEVGGG